jgi:phosphoglycolate phosphatase-like HAD superfamily hydrolase
MPDTLLLLFDIDGTLVSGATDAHRDAMHEALWAVHSVDANRVLRRPLAPAGRTDPEIARAILLDANVSAERIDDRADAVREACCRAYARLCPVSLEHTVLPGMGELLAWLSTRDAFKLGLLTGNYEAVARLKLTRAGIGRHFPGGQGAYGSDAEDRAALPKIARRRAGTVGRPHPRELTIVIGDTPRDIACARADGVRCAAVATGPFGAEELGSADAVVSDASALREVLEDELRRASAAA